MTGTWNGLHSFNHYMNLSKPGETVKDREAWCAAVHGVTKSRAWLRDWSIAIIIWFPLVSFSQITQRRARGRSLIFTEQRSVSLNSLYKLWKFFFFLVRNFSRYNHHVLNRERRNDGPKGESWCKTLLYQFFISLRERMPHGTLFSGVTSTGRVGQHREHSRVYRCYAETRFSFDPQRGQVRSEIQNLVACCFWLCWVCIAVHRLSCSLWTQLQHVGS